MFPRVKFAVMLLHFLCSSENASSAFSFHPKALIYDNRHGGYPKFTNPEESRSACGSRHVYHSPRKNLPLEPMPKIVGGTPVPHGAYPWTAHVETLSFEGFEHGCGGTIVSEYFVITAAHCIHGYGYREVRIKVGDFDSSHKDPSEKMFEIESWKVHPLFQKGGTYNNDIAIIKIKPYLGHGIQFDEYVSAACLPTKTTLYTPGTWCYVSGWGLTHPDDFYPSSVLMAASVPLMSDSICRSDKVLGSKRLKPGMICAGYLDGEIDSCNGDSGGPLVCEENGQFTLFGVVSWGIECAKRNKPGVYSNVQYYLDFIEQSMTEL